MPEDWIGIAVVTVLFGLVLPPLMWKKHENEYLVSAKETGKKFKDISRN